MSETNTEISRGSKILMAAAVIVAMLFSTITMIQSWLNHPKFSDFDRTLAIIYAGIMILVAAVCWLQRGRFLIVLASLILVLFLAFNIFGEGTAITWLLLLWILSISAGLGGITLRKLLRCPAKITVIERLAFCVSIGLGEIALIIMALGLLHLLYRQVLISALVLLTIPSFLFLLRNSQGFKESLLRFKQDWETSDLRFFSVVFSLFIICLFSGLLWTLAPNLSHDPLRYHLGMPMIYVQEHGIIDVPEEFSSLWVHSAEMLYTLALSLNGQPLPSLIHWIFGLLTTVLLFAFGARVAGQRVGLLAAILFFSIPAVTWESAISDNDLVVAFYGFAAACALLAWWQDGDNAWLPLVGLLAGFAAGTKLTAVFVLLPLYGSLASALVIRNGLSARSAMTFLRVILITLISVAPWLIRDWLWSGNPVFPYLNGIFQSPRWPGGNTLLNFANYGNGHGIYYFFRLPWDLTLHTSRYMEEAVSGFAGALPLLALPWMYLSHFPRERRLLMWMVAATTVGAILWFSISQQLRYLLTLLPVFALFSALNLEALWVSISQHIRQRQLALVIILIFSLTYITATRLTHTRWTSLPERYPFRLVFGFETQQNFLSRALPVYNALEFLDQQCEGKCKALSYGNYFRVYTRARIYGIPSLLDPQWNINVLEKLDGAKVKQQGFDFFLVNRGYLKDRPQMKEGFSRFQKNFLARFADLQFSSHGVYVYQLFDHEVPENSSHRIDLISNGGLEQIDRNSKPRKWKIYGAAFFDTTGSHSHTDRTAVRLEKAWLLQQVPVKPGALYTLGSWIRSDQPDAAARLQIEWLDQASRLLDTNYSVDGLDISGSWQWNEISATAPPEAVTARIGARVNADNKVWFDDFKFEQHLGEKKLRN